MNEQIESILNQLIKERKLVLRTGYALGITPLLGLVFMLTIYGANKGVVRPYGGDFFAVAMLFATPTLVMLGVNFAMFSVGIRNRIRAIRRATDLKTLIGKLQLDFNKDKKATRTLAIIQWSVLIVPMIFKAIFSTDFDFRIFATGDLWFLGGYLLLMPIFSLIASARISKNLEKLSQIPLPDEENTAN